MYPLNNLPYANKSLHLRRIVLYSSSNYLKNLKTHQILNSCIALSKKNGNMIMLGESPCMYNVNVAQYFMNDTICSYIGVTVKKFTVLILSIIIYSPMQNILKCDHISRRGRPRRTNFHHFFNSASLCAY